MIEFISNASMVRLCLVLYAMIMVVSVFIYGAYMIFAMKKGKITTVTPHERTFRLAFFVVLVFTIAFLSLGFEGTMKAELLGILGTIAGYVLGGVTPVRGTGQRNPAEDENSNTSPADMNSKIA